jgi:hypothetical protein
MEACKECHRARVKATTSPARRRAQHLKRNYGVTPEFYDFMVEWQGGACGICGDSAKLVVDHHHTLGHVRGLICQSCNLMLGHAKDDPERLRQAIAYLFADELLAGTEE